MADTDPDTYSPKYVQMDDIPVAGPDTYTTAQKRTALYNAEGTFELDVNEGAELASSEVTQAHCIAVLYLGTHILTYGAVAPNDVTLGDMADSGSRRDTYSSHYLEEYDRLIEKIRSASGAGGSGYGGNTSVSVNTRDPDGTEQYYPQRRDTRFPDE